MKHPKTNTYRDAQRRKTLTAKVVAYGRSSKHPWNVWYCEADPAWKGNPIALPNGEVHHVFEVHPDNVIAICIAR